MKNIQPLRTNGHKIDGSELKRDICQLLEWTQEQYCWFQYNSGIQYLENYIPNDHDFIKIITLEPSFWAWWKNRWSMRDMVFLNDHLKHKQLISDNLVLFDTEGKFVEILPLPEMPKEVPERLYREIHCPVELSKELQPNAIALGKSYAKMIGSFIDKKLSEL